MSYDFSRIEIIDEPIIVEIVKEQKNVIIDEIYISIVPSDDIVIE